MQLSQQIIKQYYSNDLGSIEVEYSPYFEGVMVTIDTQDFHYFVGFKDYSISEALSSNGVLIKAFEHMLSHSERCIGRIPDVKDSLDTLVKKYEYYYLKYHPVTINNISSCFIIEGDCFYKLSVLLENFKGIAPVTQGTIVANSYEEFIENCDRYCTGLIELVDMLSA